jgi:hypothetical protein
MTYKLTNTSQPADPYYGAVSLLLHGDGADGSTQIIDSSPNPKTVTAVDQAEISTTESKWNGSSLKFTGFYTDSLIIPDNDDFEFGSGDFTIEGWIYTQTGQGFDTVITKGWGSNPYAGFAILLATNPFDPGQGFLRFYASSNGSSWDIASNNDIITSTAQNTWYHIAVTRQGNTFRTFANGVVNQTWTSSLAIQSNTEAVTIGSSNNLGYNWQGYIDDLRITKGVARYTSNFTPPTQPFFNNFKTGYDPHYFYDVSLLLKGDGTNGSTNIVDSSFDPKTITVNGDAQISTAQSKFGGSSLKFDGTGDYLSISDTSVFNVGTGDFTIEWWQKLAATNLNYTQFKFYSNGGIKAANGAIQLYTGPSNTNVAGTTTFTTDWEHIAVVRSSGVMSFFHKGIYVPPNLANTGSATSITPTLIEIGTPFATYVNMNGYIDDFRITKGIARYTSNFTPPGPSPTF